MSEKKITLVMGKRGSGKSYLVKTLISRKRRLIIWDRMSEYSGPPMFGPETKDRLCYFLRQVYRGPFSFIYRPVHPAKEILWLSQLVYALGNVTFVVEEIDSMCTPYQLDETFEAIINRGRHKNITLIGITHAPFGIHRDLTRQAKNVYIFNTNEPRDLRYLRELLGSKATDKVTRLSRFQFALWRDGKDLIETGRA